MSKQFLSNDIKLMQHNAHRMQSFTTGLLAAPNIKDPKPMFSGPLGAFGQNKDQFDDKMTSFLR
jgi:hypothetical protein